MPYYKFLGIFVFVALLIGVVSGVFIANLTTERVIVAGRPDIESGEITQEISSQWIIDENDQTKFCYDSDGGDRAFIDGRLNAQQGVTGADYCLDPKTLVEYYCDGLVGKTININCDNCVDGKCTSVIVGAPKSDL